jgi:methylated-DNA-protein-cysteine methyltransferase-like protein
MAGAFEQVWRAVRRVPKGKVVTFGQLSKMIKHRLTPLGVAWAIHAAPKEVIPWQRVVGGGGALVKRPEKKRQQAALLGAEGVAVEKGRVDLARFGWKRA